MLAALGKHGFAIFKARFQVAMRMSIILYEQETMNTLPNLVQRVWGVCSFSGNLL